VFAVRVFVTDWERAIRFDSEMLGMAIACQSDEARGRVRRPTGEAAVGRCPCASPRPRRKHSDSPR
jgi:hypothetical protein